MGLGGGVGWTRFGARELGSGWVLGVVVRELGGMGGGGGTLTVTVNVLGSSITPELNSVQSNCESTTPSRGRV